MLRFVAKAAVAVALAVGVGLVPVMSQDGKAKPADIDFDKIEADLMKLHTPGKEHQMLQTWVGEYTIEGKMWKPGAKEPLPVNGWSSISKAGEGFVREKFTCVMPGNTRMWGEGVFGYDNDSKTFQTSWIGGWSTTQRIMTGTFDPGTETMEFKCSYKCPVMKINVSERITSRPDGKGRMVMQMFMKAEGMDEMKHGEFVYTKLN